MLAQGGALVWSPLTEIPVQIGAGALARLLHSPATARLVTQGMTFKIGKHPAQAVVSNATRLLKAVGQNEP
jgi:hypothetical protein